MWKKNKISREIKMELYGRLVWLTVRRWSLGAREREKKKPEMVRLRNEKREREKFTCREKGSWELTVTREGLRGCIG